MNASTRSHDPSKSSVSADWFVAIEARPHGLAVTHDTNLG